MQRRCLKCDHLNQAADGGDLEACPKCGAIYSRVEAMAAAGRQVRQIRTPEQIAAERAAEAEAARAAAEQVAASLAEAWHTGDWSRIPPKLVAQAQASVSLSTTHEIPGQQIDHVIDIVTAECAFGMSVFKDLASLIVDTTGGRSGAVQSTLRDARKVVLGELRKEAMALGAQAVVGVDLDYSEISGGGKSMLFVVASGTAVKLLPPKRMREELTHAVVI